MPTSQFGLDGNAPEIAAAVEAAVADGMDVINLSLGEPEIEPARDVVVAALNGAAKAGVVPTIAAGNEFGDAGNGSVSSRRERGGRDHCRGGHEERHHRAVLLGRSDAHFARR